MSQSTPTDVPRIPAPLPGDTLEALESILERAESAAVGEVGYGEDAERSLRPFQELRHVFRTHYQLAPDTAGYRGELDTQDREAFRSALARAVFNLLREVDTTEAGRAVTALSVGTNALRPDTTEFRQVADGLIAGYLTTGQYHESHEAFVTISLLLEQWLRAMADSTTEAHDILDDAVSSNTRILANLGRGLAYYAERIAAMPESSYQNAVDVLTHEADPGEFGRLISALLTAHNRVHTADPRVYASLQQRFWSGVDPESLADALGNTASSVGAGIAANPAVKTALRRGLRAALWAITREILLPGWLSGRARRNIA